MLTRRRRRTVDALQSLLTRCPAVEAMQQGQHVKRLVVGGQEWEGRATFVHYIPAVGGPLGVLRWADEGGGESGGVTLHTVTDVYGGKGYPGLPPLDVDDASCVSIIGRDGAALHLVCEGEERRRVWIDGIRELFDAVKRVGKTKETDDERRTREEGEEQQRRAAGAPTEVAANGTGYHVPEGSEREMVLHTDDSALSSAVASAMSAASAASHPSAPPHPPLSILPSIDSMAADLSVDGGFTYEVDDATAQAEVTSDARSSYTLQLERDDVDAPLSSTEQVSDALAVGESYRYLTADEPSRSAAEEAPTPPSETSTTSPTSASSSSSTSSAPPHPAVAALIAGFTFTAYTLTTCAPLHIHLDPDEGKLGTLLYSSPPTSLPTSSPHLPLPVSTLCDVFVGKQSAELRGPLALPTPPTLCFTIASREVRVHLSARREEDRATFLEGVKQLFLGQGKKVRGEEGGGWRGRHAAHHWAGAQRHPQPTAAAAVSARCCHPHRGPRRRCCVPPHRHRPSQALVPSCSVHLPCTCGPCCCRTPQPSRPPPPTPPACPTPRSPPPCVTRRWCRWTTRAPLSTTSSPPPPSSTPSAPAPSSPASSAPPPSPPSSSPSSSSTPPPPPASAPSTGATPPSPTPWSTASPSPSTASRTSSRAR